MQEKENSTKSILLIIALIVIIILLGVIIYILVNNKKANNDINSQSKTTTTTTTQKVSDEDEKVKKTIEKFLEVDCALHTDYILDYLNLGFDESKQIYDEATEMVITNVKYDDFKNAMLNYVTEEYFKKETDGFIVKDKSGYVRKSQGGGECYISKINNITKIGNLRYNVNITETSDVDDSINNNTTQKFTFKEYNNKLVVDTYSGRE